jgi:hypothetical protein
MLAWQRDLEKRWTLTKKVSHAKLKHTGWHLGEITVSLRPPSDTTSNVDFDSYDWSKFTPVPIDRATKRLILAFQGTSLVMTPPANIRGFHPAAGPTKTSPANRPNDIDEPTWSSMADASYQNITTFSPLDRSAVYTVRTTTWRHPQDPDPKGAPQPSEANTLAVEANISNHPSAHLHVNTRDEPSQSPSLHKMG